MYTNYLTVFDFVSRYFVYRCSKTG